MQPATICVRIFRAVRHLPVWLGRWWNVLEKKILLGTLLSHDRSHRRRRRRRCRKCAGTQNEHMVRADGVGVFLLGSVFVPGRMRMPRKEWTEHKQLLVIISAQ